jgi:hypothetical protein
MFARVMRALNRDVERVFNEENGSWRAIDDCLRLHGHSR